MKTKLLNIISIFTILVLATACGGDASSTPNTTNKSSSVNISVEKPSGQNVYFSKTNVDLKIASMKIDVYKTDDETDTDPSDNTLFNTKALTQDASTWKATLTALEIGSIYILDVTAKNTSGQVVSKGTTTQKIEKDVSNDVDIKLAQSSNLFDNPDELPTVNNILASQDASGKIELSFNIVNPNEESLTWSLFEAGGTSLSTEFSVNTGSTSNTGEFVKVVYTKDTNSNDTDYVLELKSTEGEIRYLFNIDFDGEAVSVTVNTPPIIESLNIVVEGDTLSITPVLDKESSDVTYAWSFDDSDDEIITNPTDKTVVITGYNEDSDFGLKLEVSENGVSSYRVYRIRGDASSEVLNILGVPKVEADALLALYASTDGENWYANENWNTLTPVSTWKGITVENGHISRINITSVGAKGTIPVELANLTNLESLSFSNNQLTGTIPLELGNLSNLRELYLNANALTGGIPQELGNLTQLTKLYLDDNKLTGTIPSTLGDLSNLDTLFLNKNQLTGEIPLELGELSNLTTLLLMDNKLTGEIPSALGNLFNLTFLRLDNNQLTGSITPANNQSFINFLNSLDYFSFNRNDDLTIENVTSN